MDKTAVVDIDLDLDADPDCVIVDGAYRQRCRSRRIRRPWEIDKMLTFCGAKRKCDTADGDESISADQNALEGLAELEVEDSVNDGIDERVDVTQPGG